MSRPASTDHAGACPPAAVPQAPRGGRLRRWARGTRSPLGLALALQATISAGDGLAIVALASRVYLNSRDAWAVAAVFLAMSVPVTALAPVAGLLLDRLRPQRVLVAAAAADAAVALAFTSFTGIPATLALAAGFGVGAALLQPGLGAIVPRLAGTTGVTRANGYLQAATWGGFTVGPLLAGGLTALGGTDLALVTVALLYGLGVVGLAVLRLTPTRSAPRPAAGVPTTAGPTTAGPTTDPVTAGPTTDPVTAGPTTAGPTTDPVTGGRTPLPGAPPGALPQPTIRAQLSAGLRFLRADADAGLLVAVVGITVAFADLAVVAEVPFAQGILRSGSTGYAMLVAAWTAGMLAGTLAGGRLPRRALAAVTLTCTVVMGLGIALAGAASVLWQAAAAYALGGLANGLEVVATRSFLNHRAPEVIAGRVFALYSGVLFGAGSLGMAVAGGLLASLDPRFVLALAGLGGIVAGAAGWALYAHRHAREVSGPVAGS